MLKDLKHSVLGHNPTCDYQLIILKYFLFLLYHSSWGHFKKKQVKCPAERGYTKLACIN